MQDTVVYFNFHNDLALQVSITVLSLITWGEGRHLTVVANPYDTHNSLTLSISQVPSHNYYFTAALLHMT